MTILVTLDFPPETGGMQRYLFDIVKHTYSPSDLVIVGTGKASGSSPAILRTPVIRVVSPMRNKKGALIPLLFVCARIAAGPGHAHFTCGNIYAAIVPWLLKYFVRCTYDVYTYGTELQGLQRRFPRGVFFRSVLQNANTLFGLSAFTTRLLTQAGITQPVTIVPPRIDLRVSPGFRDSAPTQHGVSADPCHIIGVGRLVRHKGWHILLEAFSRLPDPASWRLDIAGDGPGKSQLQQLIADLGIQDTAVLCGPVSDSRLRALYARADLFVLPSLETTTGSEGFGIVLLEAMEAGVPIVAGRSGGIVEVLENGLHGVLVPPGEPSALADALAGLRFDTAARMRYIHNAWKRLVSNYVW